jgi:tetratricopeptide (TPR) repeat protein
VALWAETQRMPRTALAFQQNASLAAPKDASSALEVARLAMQESDYARAEVWLRRAIGLAREARDWRLYSRAFAHLGDLHRARGSVPGAHRFYIRSLRGARRGGMRREQAVALHRLFSLAREAGRADEAERYARLAFDGYGGRGPDPRVADLAREVGQLWLEQGRFAEARLALEAALPFVRDPAERIRVQDELARAASAPPEPGAEHGWAEELASTLRSLRVPGGG